MPTLDHLLPSRYWCFYLFNISLYNDAATLLDECAGMSKSDDYPSGFTPKGQKAVLLGHKIRYDELSVRGMNLPFSAF